MFLLGTLPEERKVEEASTGRVNDTLDLYVRLPMMANEDEVVGVPSHILDRGKQHAGCEHLRLEDSQSLANLIRRYTAGLRYGQKLLYGKIRPRDGTDEEPASSDKRRKVRKAIRKHGLALYSSHHSWNTQRAPRAAWTYDGRFYA